MENLEDKRNNSDIPELTSCGIRLLNSEIACWCKEERDLGFSTAVQCTLLDVLDKTDCDHCFAHSRFQHANCVVGLGEFQNFLLVLPETLQFISITHCS